MRTIHHHILIIEFEILWHDRHLRAIWLDKGDQLMMHETAIGWFDNTNVACRACAALRSQPLEFLRGTNLALGLRSAQIGGANGRIDSRGGAYFQEMAGNGGGSVREVLGLWVDTANISVVSSIQVPSSALWEDIVLYILERVFQSIIPACFHNLIGSLDLVILDEEGTLIWRLVWFIQSVPTTYEHRFHRASTLLVLSCPSLFSFSPLTLLPIILPTMPRGTIDWKSTDSYTRLLAAMVAAQDMKVSHFCTVFIFSLNYSPITLWLTVVYSSTTKKSRTCTAMVLPMILSRVVFASFAKKPKNWKLRSKAVCDLRLQPDKMLLQIHLVSHVLREVMVASKRTMVSMPSTLKWFETCWQISRNYQWPHHEVEQ